MADPFINVHQKASAIIWAIARKVYADCNVHGIWIGRGWDWKSTEHATGRALDIITSTKVGRMPTKEQKARGDKLAAWFIKHADALNIRHIIWHGRIYRVRYKSWGVLPGRTASSNVSDWHYDHIHLLLDNTSGKLPSEKINLGGTSAPAPTAPTKPTAPGLPATGDKWDGVSFPGTKAFPVGKKTEATLLLQQRLKAHGFTPGALDGYFGKNTQAAVRAFQLRQGWSGNGADGIPGQQTWDRLMKAKPTPQSVSLAKVIKAFKEDAPKSGTPVSYDPIRLVEAALVREGLLSNKYQDGHAGTVTRAAYSKWQQRLGYKGTDANGIPGKSSLERLGIKYGFRVVA